MSNLSLTSRDDEPTTGPSLAPDLEFEQVRKAVEGIRYGEVPRDHPGPHGVIVQIERVEKQRLR